VTFDSKNDRHSARGYLTMRKIHVWPHIELERKVLHVSNHAYNLAPRRLIVATSADALADPILIAKETPGKRFAHHNHLRPIWLVLVGDPAARNQLYSHAVEVAGCTRRTPRRRALSRGGPGPALDDKVRMGVVAVQRKIKNPPRRFNVRQCF